MVIITEVNSFVDLVLKATDFATKLKDGWYKGSAEVDSFKDQVLMLREKHVQWSAQLRRHGVSEDERLLRAVQAAVQVLQEQEQYLRKLQKNPLLRLRKKAFPGQLSYSLKNVSAIVDAGPQLLAARVATFDVLERIGSQTPAPLPFIPDPNYAPISRSILEIGQALEDEQGPRVVTVFGGPGLGKSSVVKYLALQYQEQRKQSLNHAQRKPFSFPDGVHYLFCGKDAQVKQLQQELVQCLGFGPDSSAPAPASDPTGNGMQEGGYVQLPSHHMKLRSRLAEQKLLIVLDDVWERDVLQQLLVAAKGVRYLVTSQMKEIWGPATKIQMRNPTIEEARQIMSTYTNGLPIKGKFPDNIKTVTDAIIVNVGYHPLSLANVGISINSSRATDASHWKAINDNLNNVLHEDDLQGSPVVYEKPYNLKIGASMMLMVDSLRPDPRQLLFLIALLRGNYLPETLVRYFYKRIQPAQSTDFHLKYENYEKYLADRSLIDLHMQGNESTWEAMPYMRGKRTLACHCLRMHFIRQKMTFDVQSIAVQILESSNQGETQLIKSRDAEPTLDTILSAIYFQRPFTDLVEYTLENSLILPDGIIVRNICLGIDPYDLAKTTRYYIEELVWLLNVEHGDLDWKQQAHGYAEKIIIKLACQGKLEDCSMSGLLQLPQTTVVACIVLERYFSDNGNERFPSGHGETMDTLLALLHDDGVSTTRRAAVICTLPGFLDYESKDTILSVAAKYMELLRMESSDPNLQIAVAGCLYRFPNRATRAAMIMAEFTAILDVLMDLLVSGKVHELVRVSAAETLRWFCQWTALKIAAIPDALEKLFNLFLTTETIRKDASFGSPSDLAGDILFDLSSVEESRIKFRALKCGLDCLGNFLGRVKETWQATDNDKHVRELEAQASVVAGIVDQLALDKELRDSISSSPRLQEGLVFFQCIEIARMLSTPSWRWVSPFKSTSALIKLWYTSTIPRLTQIQEVFAFEECPPANGSLVAEAYLRIYWTRAQSLTEMGEYKAALENLDLAQHHLDQISTGGDKVILATSRTSGSPTPVVQSGNPARGILSDTRIFLQAMSGDHEGALLGTNKSLEEAQLEVTWGTNYTLRHFLVQRGIIKRLSQDLQGALDDFNAADQIIRHRLEPHILHNSVYNFFKHRGYIKYLMKDEVGARADAEAAQQLQRKITHDFFIQETRDCGEFWDFTTLPVNYLGYFVSSETRQPGLLDLLQ